MCGATVDRPPAEEVESHHHQQDWVPVGDPSNSRRLKSRYSRGSREYEAGPIKDVGVGGYVCDQPSRLSNISRVSTFTALIRKYAERTDRPVGGDPGAGPSPP